MGDSGVETLDELTITGAAARKIGRLSALRPDADICIAVIADENGRATEALQVHFCDEYGETVVERVVVRANGWSNPSVARSASHRDQRLITGVTSNA